jgi:hypothetical protein
MLWLLHGYFSSFLKSRVQNHGFFHLNPYVERPLIVGKIVVARTAVAALASAAAAAVVVEEAFVGRVLTNTNDCWKISHKSFTFVSVSVYMSILWNQIFCNSNNIYCNYLKIRGKINNIFYEFMKNYVYLKVHKHEIFFWLFCRIRNLMVPRACNMRFLKIVFDSA